MRAHRGYVIVARILAHAGRGRKFQHHREGIDVCDDQSEARDQVEDGKQVFCHMVGSNEQEDQHERNHRKGKPEKHALTPADLDGEDADGDKSDRGDRHRHAADDGRHARRLVQHLGAVDRKVAGNSVVAHKPHKGRRKDEEEAALEGAFVLLFAGGKFLRGDDFRIFALLLLFGGSAQFHRFVVVADAVGFAFLLAFLNVLGFVYEEEEGNQKQHHRRRADGKYLRKGIIRYDEARRIDNEGDSAADAAHQVDHRVGLRAQRLGGHVGHQRHGRRTEGCHRNQHEEQNGKVNAYPFGMHFGDLGVDFLAGKNGDARLHKALILFVMRLDLLILRLGDLHRFGNATRINDRSLVAVILAAVFFDLRHAVMRHFKILFQAVFVVEFQIVVIGISVADARLGLGLVHHRIELVGGSVHPAIRSFVRKVCRRFHRVDLVAQTLCILKLRGCRDGHEDHNDDG